MTGDATAFGKAGAEFAHHFRKDRIFRLGMGAGAEIGVGQSPAQHARLRVDRRHVRRHLVEEPLRLVRIILVRCRAPPRQGQLGQRERILAPSDAFPGLDAGRADNVQEGGAVIGGAVFARVRAMDGGLVQEHAPFDFNAIADFDGPFCNGIIFQGIGVVQRIDLFGNRVVRISTAAAVPEKKARKFGPCNGTSEVMLKVTLSPPLATVSTISIVEVRNSK